MDSPLYDDISNVPRETLSIILTYTDNTSRFSLSHVSTLFRNSIRELGPLACGEEVCIDVAKNGYFSLLNWCLENIRNHVDLYRKRMYKLAAGNGHLDVIRLLNHLGYVCDDKREMGVAAAEGDHLHVLKWLKFSGYTWHVSIAYEAARGGRFEVVKWLSSNGCPLGTAEGPGMICDDAALSGHLEMLQWLTERGHPINARACIDAIQGGDLEIVKWLNGRGDLYEARRGELCMYAAEYNRFEILKYLVDNYYELCTSTFTHASARGHFELLKWAKGMYADSGCPWDEQTCSNIAKSGDIDTLRWARECGCPWNEQTCTNAATNGRFELLKWARENGCPWDEDTLSSAIASNHIEMIEWCLDNGCVLNRRAFRQVVGSGAVTHFDALECLLRRGCEFTPKMCLDAAELNHLDMLKWLRSNDCPWGIGYPHGICGLSPRVKEWLKTTDCPWII